MAKEELELEPAEEEAAPEAGLNAEDPAEEEAPEEAEEPAEAAVPEADAEWHAAAYR